MNPLHTGNDNVDFVITLLIVILLPLAIYKLVIPVISKVYKMALILFGSFLSWIGFFGALQMPALSPVGAVGRILLAVAAAVALSAFSFVLASFIGRLEKLEGK